MTGNKEGMRVKVSSHFTLKESLLPLSSNMGSSFRIYILTNKHNTTLYVGVTNNLPARLWEHRTKRNPKCFTARYNIFKLIYFESFDSIEDAIKREKYIKGKKRQWKEDLIKTMNPEWKDLTNEV
jgi:putative endonuclease